MASGMATHKHWRITYFSSRHPKHTRVTRSGLAMMAQRSIQNEKGLSFRL
ncbi:hypothetical protein [Escherichia coli]